MIYGANGYTGRLCAIEAARRGYKPVLAGRSGEAVEAVARQCGGLETRIFSLDDPRVVADCLDDMAAVLHCAGPFSATSIPMLTACERSKTYYFDITGEIDVFEYVHSRDTNWRKASIVVMPGVGFDVVPSDCLAAMLKRELPDATHLRMAFRSKRGKMSPGTTKTVIEGLPKGGKVRRDGKYKTIPPGSLTAMIPFGDTPELAVAIPWGDLATAYRSTGIPNIEIYMGLPEKQINQMRTGGRLRWLFGLGLVQRYLKKRVERTVKGPSDEERATDEVILWGEVTNAAGARVTMRMRTPEGYTHTVDAAITAVTRGLSESLQPGALTPSMAFGPDFVLSLPGVTCTRID
jgi:short subunit dehydrogenase-like uncharacterized protein